MKRTSPLEPLQQLFYRTIGVSIGQRPTDRTKPLWDLTGSVLQELLDNGWTADEIRSWILSHYRLGCKASSLAEAMPPRSRRRQMSLDQELMTPEDHHPALYRYTPPKISIRTGQGTSPALDRLTTFKAIDLVERFESKISGPLTDDGRKALLGMVGWCFREGATLSELLYAMDAMRDEEERSIQQIPRYLQQGKEQARWTKA